LELLLLLQSLMLIVLWPFPGPSRSSTLETVSKAAAGALVLLLVVALLLLLSGCRSGQPLQRQATALPAAGCKQRVLLSCQAGQWVCMLLLA
jgi:hypothetical protein